jgi:dTDP-4-amino-4,6-dideoxygalactose transaminase
MTDEPIQFIDLGAQQRRIAEEIDRRIRGVLAHGHYIMGPEVSALERELANFCGARHSISCANGTDALMLALMAKGLKAGDAVLCPSFTFAATAEAVACLGATPVFVDVLEDSFNLDPASLEAGIATVDRLGLRAVGVIAVDLFGQPADYDAIEPICKKHGLWLVCDAAQSFGAQRGGRRVGTIGAATTTSFFPAKPLGCYGDGGAIFTDDDEMAQIMRSLRVHGQGTDKYQNVRVGMNSRLDTLQAAILLPKLAIFASEIEARNAVALRYSEALPPIVTPPMIASDVTHVWAQYTIRVPAARRDRIAEFLKSRGVPSAVYYPRPLHQQPAYRQFPCAAETLPCSERLSQEVLSLPMHPYLSPIDQDRVIDALIAGLAD